MTDVAVQDMTVTPTVEGASPGLAGVVGIPAGEGPWPGVVVVHEAFGVDDVMRRQVRRIAEAGFLALMPNLFTAGGTRRCLGATFKALRAGEGRAFADIESARQLLLARADCTGRLGIIGFCMGGGFAIVAAGKGFDASAPNYGMLPKDLDSVLADACPVVASYGGKDRGLKGAAATLEAALSRAGVPHDVREYPNAGHSFLNDGPVGPMLMRPLVRIMGAGPEPDSATDAWRRIEAFFGEHLRG